MNVFKYSWSFNFLLYGFINGLFEIRSTFDIIILIYEYNSSARSLILFNNSLFSFINFSSSTSSSSIISFSVTFHGSKLSFFPSTSLFSLFWVSFSTSFSSSIFSRSWFHTCLYFFIKCNFFSEASSEILTKIAGHVSIIVIYCDIPES